MHLANEPGFLEIGLGKLWLSIPLPGCCYGNCQWSRVNLSLYSICFTGVARLSVRCDLCLSLNHRSKDCVMVANYDQDEGSCLKAAESAVLALTQLHWSVPNAADPPRGVSSEVYWNFNKARCCFSWCHYRHACWVCGGPQLGLALDARCNWWVMAPNAHHRLFLVCHLCILTCITWKLQVIYEHSTYQTTVPLSKTFLLWFRVAWEIWLESYDPRHVSQSFSDITLYACCKHLRRQIVKILATLLVTLLSVINKLNE